MAFGSLLRRIQSGVVEYYFVFLVLSVGIIMIILELMGGI